MPKIIVAGSRDMTDYDKMKQTWAEYVNEHNLVSDRITIITGGASGADRLAEQLAKEENISIEIIKADWQTHGKAAGPIRNRIMAEAAAPDGRLLAYWDGKSPGTADMIKQARRVGLKVQTIELMAPTGWEQCRLE